jgi:hypothetical protein
MGAGEPNVSVQCARTHQGAQTALMHPTGLAPGTLEKALDLEPIAKPVGPGTCRQADLPRAETVPAR